MIEIDPNTRMIYEDKLDAVECYHFMREFLVPEIRRHIDNYQHAVRTAKISQSLNPVVSAAWTSAAERHVMDIIYTYKAVQKLCKRYHIPLYGIELYPHTEDFVKQFIKE